MGERPSEESEVGVGQPFGTEAQELDADLKRREQEEQERKKREGEDQ